MSTNYSTADSYSALLTTALNSLADGANKITTAPIVNSTAKDLFANFKLDLSAQTASRDLNGKVEMYILPEVDGSFAYGGDSLDPAIKHFVGSFEFDATATARTDVLAGVSLPNSDFHVLLINTTGQAFASSGNELGYQLFDGYEDA